MSRTFPRKTANTIAALCILLNCLVFFAYLATFFHWNLSPEKAVDGDELMDPVPLLIMAGCVCVIVLTIVLQMTRMRLAPSKSARNVVRYFGFYGAILYLVTAVCFPRYPLRFNGPIIETNDGKRMQIQPTNAERIFRQNTRRNIGSLIFFGNIAMNWFFIVLSAKQKESLDESSSSDDILGEKKRGE